MIFKTVNVFRNVLQNQTYPGLPPGWVSQAGA